MDILELMKERHSVRQYKNQTIESSKREEINSLINAVNAESKLSIPVDISHILGNLITVIFDYQILRKPLKILSL